MKRLTFVTFLSALAIAAAAPGLADPGGGGHGGGGGGNAGAMGGIDNPMRDAGRAHSQGAEYANPRAIDRANQNSVLKGTTDTTGTAPAGLSIRHHDSTSSRTREQMRSDATSSMSANTKLTGVTSGMTVVDGSGATVGTVTGVTTKGNGSIRTVQVTLANGQIVTLAPNSLSLNGGVLTTTSTTTNVNSQGAAHANINGLIHASPNSALASAGVTSLTGLATGLTVNNSAGTAIGTVDSIVTNRSGAVVAVRVNLNGGGTATIPATTLSMNGSTVVTSSTQF